MFQRHTGLGAQNQARTLGRCSVGRGQFTVGVCHPLKSDGGQQDRVFQRAPQQRGAGAGPRHAAQHTGVELQGVPRAAVGAQGDFVARAAAEIGPGVCIQVGVGVVGVVFQGDDTWRNAAEFRHAHTSAHIRRRLWYVPVSAVVDGPSPCSWRSRTRFMSSSYSKRRCSSLRTILSIQKKQARR